MPIEMKTPLREILELAPACGCRECVHGCTMGAGILVGDDLKNMATLMGIDEDELKETHLETVEQFGKMFLRPKLLRKDGKPYGRCIFLDKNGECKVHEAKPLQCKIAMGCKDYGEDLSLWFMLNKLVDKDDLVSMRHFKLYLDSGGKTLKDATFERIVPSKKKRDDIMKHFGH